jgi:hypothetical protein
LVAAEAVAANDDDDDSQRQALRYLVIESRGFPIWVHII